MNNLGLTSIVLAMNLSEWAIVFMQFNISSLQLYSTAFFEKAFAFVWALHDFQDTNLIYMLNHFPSLNTLPAIIFTLDFKVQTEILNMVIYLIQWHLFSTIENAFYNSVWTFIFWVLIHIFPSNFSAIWADWTFN